MNGLAWGIAGLVGLVVAIVLYGLFVPKGTRRFTPDNSEQAEFSPFLKAMNVIGDEFYKALPGKNDPLKKSPRLERVKDLIVKSGNPWGLKPHEFIAMQYMTAVVGFFAGWAVAVFMAPFTNMLPWWVVVPFATVFGYLVPPLQYRDLAKKRDFEFKRDFSDALGYLEIALSGRSILPDAIRKVTPSIPETSVLRVEFDNMVRDLNAGKTMEEALDNFIARAPNDETALFLNSLRDAHTNSADMTQMIMEQSEIARDSYFAVITNRVAQLDSKMLMIMIVTMIPALMIASIAPSLESILQGLSG